MIQAKRKLIALLKRPAAWGNRFYSPSWGQHVIECGGMARKIETQMQAELGPKRYGRFYLQELLNSGGMADIWLVTDERNKPYALRKLRDNLRFNFLARRRFNRGCQVLSQLNESDYIVGYVEHGKANALRRMIPKTCVLCGFESCRER